MWAEPVEARGSYLSTSSRHMQTSCGHIQTTDSTLQQPPVRAPDVLRAERGKPAPPTKIDQRIGIRLDLKQLRHHLTLQTAEGGSRSEGLAGSAYGIHRNVCREVEASHGHRLQRPTIAIGRE